MALSDINEKLLAQLPNLVLSSETFDNDPDLTNFLEQYFSQSAFQVKIHDVQKENYSYDETAGTITFSGTGSEGPFDGWKLEKVVIKMVDEKPQVAISATGTEGWDLHTGFPTLNVPILQQLGFQKPILEWASYNNEADDTQVGFYFEGNLDLEEAPLVLLTFLFPNMEAPVMFGQIEMVGSHPDPDNKEGEIQYVPDAVLNVDGSNDSVTLGPFTLVGPQAKILLNPVYNTVDKAWANSASFDISTALKFKEKSFLFDVQVQDPKNNIQFEALLHEPLGAALSDIVNFVGGTALGIPGFKIALPDGLLLKNIKLGVDPSAEGSKKVKFIALDVGMNKDEKWQLWSDKIFLSDIDVGFQLLPGAGEGGKTEVDGNISGTIDDMITLAATFSTEGNYSFSGGIVEDKEISLQQLYQFFTDSQEKNEALPDLAVSKLDFELDLPPKEERSKFTFSGEIEVDGEWDIVTQPVKFAVNRLLFKVNRDGEQHDTSFTSLAIMTLQDYSLLVEADYETNKGWNFKGDLELSEEKPKLSDMGGKIDETFQLDTPKKSIPPFFADWYVEKLDLDFNTQSKDFNFFTEAKNSAYPALDLSFAIHLLHSDTSITKEFDGVIKVQNEKFDVEFDLTIKEEDITEPNPSKTFSVTADYKATSPPKLSDFIAAVAKENNVNNNLPAALDLDAEADGFAIEIKKKDQDPTTFEMAGEFGFDIKGSKWDLFFAFTNDTSFEKKADKESNQQETQSLSSPTEGKLPFVFGMAVSGMIDLSKLPLVGKIPGVGDLKIDKLGFYYTNAEFTDTNKKLDFKVPDIGAPNELAPNPTEASLTKKGFTLMAVIGKKKEGSDDAFESNGSMGVPLSTGDTTPGQAPQFNSDQSLAKDPIKWLNLNKTFGPVSMEKIGLSFQKPKEGSQGQLGTIGFFLDGSFKISGFEMALDRLGISFTLPKPGAGSPPFNPISDIGFHLGGMFVNFQTSGLQIAGGFISIPGEEATDFIGEFILRVASFGIQAYGGFSNQVGHPSLFILLHLEVPLGGPPFFFINGVSGGFGVNRAFKLPTFDQLLNYPLIPTNSVIPSKNQLGGDAKQQLATMTQSLTLLEKYIPPKNGEYWFALGLDVTSFEMIEVSAILSVAFGVEFQVGVIGSASMTLPVEEPEPIAFIQIDFEVIFAPSQGLLAVMGKITPASFVFANVVHLQGGFAFYLWFGGAHAGNFMVSIGGFNPHFNRPAFYPDIPRMALIFKMGPLTVGGKAYFALVPSALMAGLDIHASFVLGPIQAWFDVGMDFLLSWKPFHYEADAWIHIGVGLVINLGFVHIRLVIHVGVDLSIWGPQFGGKALVDLDIISFTIKFGAGQERRITEWKDFREFLPSVDASNTDSRSLLAAAALGDSNDKDEKTNKPLVNISVPTGLVKEFAQGEVVDDINWIIDANHFEILTDSIAPCSHATFNKKTDLKSFTSFVDPNNLEESVKEAIDNKEDMPFFAYAPPKTGKIWNKIDYGIPPMDLQDIESNHTVLIYSLDDEGNRGQEVEDLIVELQSKSYSPALWGNEAVTKDTLKAEKQTIDHCLSGFLVRPMIWFPKRTSFIPYYYLVFDTNNLFLAQESLPKINTDPFDNPSQIFEEMETGTAFSKTEPVRTSILDSLVNVGFDHLELKNDSFLKTDQYAGDPILTFMSSTPETDL